jgi:hypothetical protein
MDDEMTIGIHNSSNNNIGIDNSTIMTRGKRNHP